MFRDENCCVFTGILDLTVAKSQLRVPERRMDVVQVAHIISQSLSENTEGAAPEVRAKVATCRAVSASTDTICLQFEWAKTAGAIIERFGGFSIHELLGDAVLNSPLNTFAASFAPHQEFDQLDMWLTPAQVCSFVISASSPD